MKRPGTCVHFRGIQHATCAAGVAMASVRDSSQPGPYRWPCLDRDATTTCPQFREPTDDEIAADQAAWEARLDKMRENAKAGLCNDCEQKITAVKQVGKCVYAEPCGHRIGQGDAKQVRKALGLS